MPLRVTDLASLQVFTECHQNVPKWVGKVQNMFLSRIWADGCKKFQVAFENLL